MKTFPAPESDRQGLIDPGRRLSLENWQETDDFSNCQNSDGSDLLRNGHKREINEVNKASIDVAGCRTDMLMKWNMLRRKRHNDNRTIIEYDIIFMLRDKA
jgi:hypothetical protein